MFFFSVTRQSIARGIDAPSVREFPMGGWVVTVVTDDWLSSCDAERDRVTVREAPPFAHASGARDLVFAEASFRAKDGTAELYKAPLGGRHFYYHLAPRGDGVYCASHAALLRLEAAVVGRHHERRAFALLQRQLRSGIQVERGVHDRLWAGVPPGRREHR